MQVSYIPLWEPDRIPLAFPEYSRTLGNVAAITSDLVYARSLSHVLLTKDRTFLGGLLPLGTGSSV